MGEWLESLLPWGADVIVWAQSHSTTWLDSIFRVFTALGYEEAYLIVLPLVYWCVHKQIGAALSYISLASAWANSLVKHIFLLPRPAAPPIEMRAPRSEVSPSFPSGHAQNAVVIWGYMAYRLRDWRAWPVAVTLMAGIGISRVALGVHFPQDVIGGWLIGAGLLLGYVWLAPAAARWLQRRQFGVQILLAVSLPVALILLSPSNAAGVYPVEGVVTPMAAMAGVGVGLIMERSLVGFSVEGEWWRRLLRFVVGALLTGALYLGPELLRPSEASMPHGLDVTVRFAHYAVLGRVFLVSLAVCEAGSGEWRGLAADASSEDAFLVLLDWVPGSSQIEGVAGIALPQGLCQLSDSRDRGLGGLHLCWQLWRCDPVIKPEAAAAHHPGATRSGALLPEQRSGRAFPESAPRVCPASAGKVAARLAQVMGQE